MNWWTWIIVAAVIASPCALVDYAQRHLEKYVARKHFDD